MRYALCCHVTCKYKLSVNPLTVCEFALPGGVRDYFECNNHIECYKVEVLKQVLHGVVLQ